MHSPSVQLPLLARLGQSKCDMCHPSRRQAVIGSTGQKASGDTLIQSGDAHFHKCTAVFRPVQEWKWEHGRSASHTADRDSVAENRADTSMSGKFAHIR